MTLFNALQAATETLKAAWTGRQLDGEHNPQLEAQIILSKLLGTGRAHLLAHATDDLPNETAAHYQDLIARRGAFEPVAYLFGEEEFYRRKFAVSRDTLIPRPESEELIDEALKAPDGTMFWDIGTGSGALGITLALEHPHSLVVASDISSAALTVAKHNAEQHGVTNRVRLLEGNLLAPIFKELGAWLKQTSPEQVVIVANLPYVPEPHRPFLDPDVTAFEPGLALFGGFDGLDLYRALFKQLYQARHDAPRTVRLLMEVDPTAEKILPRLLKEEFPHASAEILRDFKGQVRIITAAFPLRSKR